MPGFIGNSACTDTWGLYQFKTMYDLGIAMAKVRWNVQSKGTPFTSHDISARYAFWLRCVANNDVTITSKWRYSGGRTMPTAGEFVDAVQNGPGSSQMAKLKGW